jgi:rare lipoprotein A
MTWLLQGFYAGVFTLLLIGGAIGLSVVISGAIGTRLRADDELRVHLGVEPIRRTVKTGEASYYGELYRGRRMANGKPFNPDALTCATWDWPLGAVLEVRRTCDSKRVRVIVTDRGPAEAFREQGRIIDLSVAAFERLAPRWLCVIDVYIEEVRP